MRRRARPSLCFWVSMLAAAAVPGGAFATGLVQQMLMVSASWSFDLALGRPAPRP